MILESKIHSFFLIKDSRIDVNLESNHLKKRFESTFSLGLSKKTATRFESQIIDSDSQVLFDGVSVFRWIYADKCHTEIVTSDNSVRFSPQNEDERAIFQLRREAFATSVSE